MSYACLTGRLIWRSFRRHRLVASRSSRIEDAYSRILTSAPVEVPTVLYDEWYLCTSRSPIQITVILARSDKLLENANRRWYSVVSKEYAITLFKIKKSEQTNLLSSQLPPTAVEDDRLFWSQQQTQERKVLFISSSSLLQHCSYSFGGLLPMLNLGLPYKALDRNYLLINNKALNKAHVKGTTRKLNRRPKERKSCSTTHESQDTDYREFNPRMKACLYLYMWFK